MFKSIVDFFNYLFVDESNGKLLNERCYIVITRKGFSLWLAGVLCGLIGKKIPGPNILISDRNWKKKTVEERNVFIENKHVYIVDDSVITGATTQYIYLGIDLQFAKSRNVAFLTSEINTSDSYRRMFQSYKDFDAVSVDARRAINEKILFALYQLPIPLTAESPSYHLIRFPASEFKEWETPSAGWRFELTPLDFSGSGKVETFLLHAPNDAAKYGANVLFRGMRVCYRKYVEDNSEFVDICLIPWVMFDAIDYGKAVDYLLKQLSQIDEYKGKLHTSWIYKQLIEGEPSRKRNVVHRVISYLYDICIVNEFEKVFLKGTKLQPYVLPNGNKLEQYHYGAELLSDIEHLISVIFQAIDSPDCITKALYMTDEEHNELRSSLFGMSYSKLEIPISIETIENLAAEFCGLREPAVDMSTNLSTRKSPIKEYPLLCYSMKDCGVNALNLIRRSIASFHSEIISYKENLYLINTLYPGEGSPLVFVDNYDFIYGLHCFANSRSYARGREYQFYEKWECERISRKAKQDIEKFDVPELSTVSSVMLDHLFNMSSYYWPCIRAISEYYNKRKPSDMVSLKEITNISKRIIAEIEADYVDGDSSFSLFSEIFA